MTYIRTHSKGFSGEEGESDKCLETPGAEPLAKVPEAVFSGAFCSPGRRIGGFQPGEPRRRVAGAHFQRRGKS